MRAQRSSERPSQLRAVLFDADGRDQRVDLESVDPKALSERQLLWVDVQLGDDDGAAPALDALGLRGIAGALDEKGIRPQLQNFGECSIVRAVAISHPGKLQFQGQALTLVLGRNFVLTLHPEALPYLTELTERERGDTQLGMLSAEGFTASLLDWLLTTYFEAVADLEAAIDRLEVQMLAHRVNGTSVPGLAQLRRAASRLRRLLVPHRLVFGAMARPDFRPDLGPESVAQFHALQERFERCLDMVENARDLVIGSFELFSTRMAQQTNETMRVLTFFTALLGTLAVIAGVLGMNFKAPVFETGTRGFTVTIGSMVALVVCALLVARWRRWW